MFEYLSPHVLQIRDLVHAEEVHHLRSLAASFGFKEQVYEPPLIPEVRTRAMGVSYEWASLLTTRVISHLQPLSAWLNGTLAVHLPPQPHQWRPKAVNERFRFYRYGALDRFAPHLDHPFIRNPKEQTFLSLVLYLDDQCEGGETRFPDFSVQPTSGTALIYPHWLMHEGGIVRSGIKTVLRTDVFYDQTTL
ncbi:MAG TPA: 2OG-Fe(II) oxygenase [Rhodothermales bacterium]|mgnify:CR=1 FL=1|nr:2OG-Fe(II) oxygenase [Rhodothermales bacterium]